MKLYIYICVYVYIYIYMPWGHFRIFIILILQCFGNLANYIYNIYMYTHTHIYIYIYIYIYIRSCRLQRSRDLRRTSKTARLLRLCALNPPEARLSVCCECCVLSGRGLCDALITRPEESYRLWRFAVCDLETSRMRRPWPALGRSATGKIYIYIYIRDDTTL